jgi:hypothetical protein
MDEWGRITESATSIYDGFLNALNTGNFSGFFSNMDRIIQSARDAYDAMDDLGTFSAFNQINELNARAKMDSAIAAFREGTGSQSAVSEAGSEMISQLEQRRSLQEQAYASAIAKLASSRGVDADMLTKALSGSYGDYNTLKNLGLTGQKVSTKAAVNVASGQAYTWEETTAVAANEQEALGQMLRGFTDDELQALQQLGADAARTSVEIAAVEKQLARIIKATNEGGGDKGKEDKADIIFPEGTIARVKQRITELNKALEMAGDQNTRDRIKTQIDELKSELNEMTNSALPGQHTQIIPLSVELLDTSTEQLTADVEALREKLGMDPIKLGITTGGSGGVVDTAEATEKAWGAAANAIQSIGGALQQIEDPSAKVAGIIAQAVANIALSYAEASASPAVTGTGWGWLGFAAAGLATMISTIASIKQVTQGFADGGMVGGNSYSGDNIVARLNSGEGVLTANGVRNAQAMAANANPMGGMQLEALVSGESLRLVLANNASRRGGSRGQYAISKFG